MISVIADNVREITRRNRELSPTFAPEFVKTKTGKQWIKWHESPLNLNGCAVGVTKQSPKLLEQISGGVLKNVHQ